MQTGTASQVFSGIRLAAFIIGGFLGILCLVDGELRLVRGLESRHLVDVLIGCIEVAAVAVILWLTAAMWSRWVAAVAALGALKAAAGLVLGASVSPPYVEAPRFVIVETLICFIILAILCFRFLTYRPTRWERAALLLLVFSVPASALWPSSHSLAVIAIPALWLSRLVQYQRHKPDGFASSSGANS